MKLSKREIVLLVVLIVVVFLGGYYRFLMSPLLESLAKEREVLQTNQDELNILKAKQSSMEKLLKEVEELEENNKEIMKNLPPYISFAEIIIEIEILNKQSGGIINNLSFVVGTPSSEYSILAMPISWSDTYNQLMNFLSSIEQSKRKLVVDNINIISSEAQSGTSVEASFTLSTFTSSSGEHVFKNPEKFINYNDIKVNVFSYSKEELFNITQGNSEHYDMIKGIINKYLEGNN